MMRIGVLAYDFPHWKTQHGIINLVMNRLKPGVIFAAPWRELGITPSKISTAPRDRYLIHPKKVALMSGVEYVVCPHEDIADAIKQSACDIGIILGARVLPAEVIDAFNVGVINMHPGMLPDNRGLDNVKWAVLKDLPQGVTTHFIDGRVDCGRLITWRSINIYIDDSLVAMQGRVQELEQEMMVDAVSKVLKGLRPEMCPELNRGTYHHPMSERTEENMLMRFADYKATRAVDL